MAAKISISIPDPELLRWAQAKAEHDGTSLSALFSELARRARQAEALSLFLAEAGAPELTPELEAEIRAELEGKKPRKRRNAGARRAR